MNEPASRYALRPLNTAYAQAALLAHVLKQPRAHRTAEQRVEHVARIPIVVLLRIAADAQAEVTLLELLVPHQRLRHDARRVLGVRLAGLRRASRTFCSMSSRTCACSRLPAAETIRFRARVGVGEIRRAARSALNDSTVSARAQNRAAERVVLPERPA